MNLHGYLARERIHYGSEEGVDFTNIYFYTVFLPRAARVESYCDRTGKQVRWLREVEIRLG